MPFLPQAVASVLKQTYSDFELLIYDDASTDGSWEWLNTLSDPRTRIQRNVDNLGPEANWNQALAEAQGTYIKVFHQDDLLDPDCLARQVEILEADHGTSLTFCRRRIIDQEGRLVMYRGMDWSMGSINGERLFRRCLHIGTNPIGEPSAVLFRAQAARAAGSFEGSQPYVIDLDYWLRLLDHGTARYLHLPLASFRLSSSQWSSAIGWKQSEQFNAYIKSIVTARYRNTSALQQIWSRFMARLNGVLRGVIRWWFSRKS